MAMLTLPLLLHRESAVSFSPQTGQAKIPMGTF
jgi:hypothetical protein